MHIDLDSCYGDLVNTLQEFNKYFFDGTVYKEMTPWIIVVAYFENCSWHVNTSFHEYGAHFINMDSR